MAFRISYNESTLNNGLEKMKSRVDAAVMMYAQTKAVMLQAQMKQERPWTDRTGMAKATLRVQVSRPSNGKIRITLAHGVEYGVYLELKHNKNYAIVGPTVEREGPRMVSELGGLMSKLK